MNLILFDRAELAAPLAREDPRAVHVCEVLRRKVGETFDAGVINGPRGKGSVVASDEKKLTLAFTWTVAPAPLVPITLLVGLPRPQTARDILRDATTLGVQAIHFVLTEKCEPNYAQSSLWSSGEWRRYLIAGAAQAFVTCIPDISVRTPLVDLLPQLPLGSARVALDNYEAYVPLGRARIGNDNSAVIAIGAERGWSARERDYLRASNFELAHLGARVLRTETAVVVAVALIRDRLGTF